MRWGWVSVCKYPHPEWNLLARTSPCRGEIQHLPNLTVLDNRDSEYNVSTKIKINFFFKRKKSNFQKKVNFQNQSGFGKTSVFRYDKYLLRYSLLDFDNKIGTLRLVGMKTYLGLETSTMEMIMEWFWNASLFIEILITLWRYWCLCLNVYLDLTSPHSPNSNVFWESIC